MSKNHKLFEIYGFRGRERRGSSFQNGFKAEMRAHSIGVHKINKKDILTPISARFPPQAFDLKIDSFCGVSYFRNISAIKL